MREVGGSKRKNGDSASAEPMKNRELIEYLEGFGDNMPVILNTTETYADIMPADQQFNGYPHIVLYAGETVDPFDPDED